MFAVVESGNITSMPPGTTGLVVDGIKHPRTIFTLWTEAERNAIGVYTVIIDNTNKKSSEQITIRLIPKRFYLDYIQKYLNFIIYLFHWIYINQ